MRINRFKMLKTTIIEKDFLKAILSFPSFFLVEEG
ncbi:hypothetical protein A1S_3746 [Acinetobacter baumannii ATCC 17978]|nr:hypothetical protein A1S_3746 [Acinetobacter baumannii ATCC 17978]